MKPRRTAAFAKPAAVSAACGGEWRLDRLQAVRHRALRGRWCRRDIHSTAAVCVLTLPSLSKWDKPSPTYAARAWSFGWSVNALPLLQHTTPCPATSTAAKDKRVRCRALHVKSIGRAQPGPVAMTHSTGEPAAELCQAELTWAASTSKPGGFGAGANGGAEAPG